MKQNKIQQNTMNKTQKKIYSNKSTANGKWFQIEIIIDKISFIGAEGSLVYY